MKRQNVTRFLVILGFGALFAAGVALAGPGAGACCGGCGGAGGDEAAASTSTEPGCGAGCCGQGRGGRGHGAQRRARGGMADGHHQNIHGLLDQHEAIQREVKEIEGGVETVTTSEDPEVTRMIREHVRQMEQRVESGHGLRWWDPTFAELFSHHEKIVMEIEDVPGGVKVRETSEDPDVALLIRQHAIRGVSEFVARGFDRAQEPTPLPEGYPAAKASESANATP